MAPRASTPCKRCHRMFTDAIAICGRRRRRLPRRRSRRRRRAPRQARRRRVRGVRELAEQAGHDERHLLADVDGVVADPLERARDEHHVHRPLARVGVVADLDRRAEDLAVEPVDLAVLAHEVLGQADVAPGERGLALDDLRAREGAHLGERLEHLRCAPAARSRRAGSAWRCSRTGRPCARCA